MSFTRNLEDSWLGPWKYVLLGEWSNHKRLNLVHKKLMCDLKSKCKLDVNESLLKVILGCSKYDFEEEACISQLCPRRGCYVSRGGCFDKAKCGTSSNASYGVDQQSEFAFQLIQEAMSELEGEDSVNREPIILVLDCEVQVCL
jgi:separase